jgi:dihydrofolate reductase
MSRMKISLIAAVARNGVIGRDGTLPWRLPRDLRWFREKTSGHHLVVGRRTWETLSGALPHRTMVVVTRDRGYQADGAVVAHSLDEALDVAREAGDDEVFIGGGAEIYRQALPHADRFYLTEVGEDFDGDTRFPDWDPGRWRVDFEEEGLVDEVNRHPHRFRVLVPREANLTRESDE